MPAPATDGLTAVDENPPPFPFTLREIAMPGDFAFLLDVYADSRASEMASVPWPEAHKRAFLSQQFAAQHADYHNTFVHRRFCIIERKGRPIGRLYLAAPEALRIVDIALVAKVRGRGYGTTLIRWLIAVGATSGIGVELHVRRDNPAQRLYERLGFVAVEARGPYEFMRRAPN